MRRALAFCLLSTVFLGPAALAQDNPALTKVSVHTAPNAAPAEAAPAVIGDLWRWRVLRTAWTEQDERAYEEFVARIGDSDCKTVHECLTDAKANPFFRASNPADMRFYADCADLPYLLRAYFAWKNALPFAYSAAVSPTGRSQDARYNTSGNHVSSRRDLTWASIDARQAIPQMTQAVTSAHYRYAPRLLRQAAARPLSREDFAREHQARHHPLRSQRPPGRRLQGDARKAGCISSMRIPTTR